MTLRRWLLILAASAALCGTGTRAEEPDFKKAFDEFLPGMGAEKNFEQPQQKWQELCTQAGAPGHEAQRKAVCALMAEKLGPQTPARARIWLLKQLERIGHGECVEAMAPIVTDGDPLVRDAAIRALANNPDPGRGGEASRRLEGGRRGWSEGGAHQRAGLPREPDSVDVLAHAALSDNPAIASASAHALGRIGSPPAVHRPVRGAPRGQG